MIGDRASNLLQLLIRINRDVAGALDLRTVLQRLIFSAMQHVGGERASIIVVDDTGMPVDATIVYGANLHEHTTRQLGETLDRGLAGWVIRNRKPALVPDTSLDERWLRRPDDAPGQSGPKSAVCVPLVARDRIVGALTIVHSVPDSFGSDHLDLAGAIADQASIAVLNARLYSESTRQARIMTALAEGAASFGSSLDLQEVWERILNRTIEALQVETAALGMLDEAEGQIVFRAAAGQNAVGIIGHKTAQDKSLAGEALRQGAAILVVNAAEDPRFTKADRFAAIDVRAIMFAPIQSQGRAMGVLAAINPVAGRFDPDDGTVLHGIGGLAGTTIHNAQLYEQLQKAQRHYLELFEETMDMVLVTDWEGRITDANRQAVQVTGFAPEHLHAMNIRQLQHVDWRKVGKGFVALRRQGAVSYESTVQTAGGRSVAVEVHARPMEFAAADAILDQEGMIDKFMGDAVMGLFNAPLPQPDHAIRAVRAALGIRDAIRELHQQLPEEFHLAFGVGVHYGDAVLGLVGTENKIESTAIGDSVNTAKRIQENAPANVILISGDAYRLIPQLLDVRQVEPVIAKGKRQPVEVYEVLGLKTD